MFKVGDLVVSNNVGLGTVTRSVMRGRGTVDGVAVLWHHTGSEKTERGGLRLASQNHAQTSMGMFKVGDQVVRTVSLGTVVENDEARKRINVLWHYSGEREWEAYANVQLDSTQRFLDSLDQDVKTSNKTIFMEGKYSDFKIICGNSDQETRTSIPCHKVFLANESPYFAGMFESGMQEAGKAEVEIQEYDVEVVKSFIEFIYTKEIEPEMMKSNMDLFLKIADQFRVESLKAVIQAAMMKSITKDNVLELLLTGHHYNGKAIKAAAIAFLVKNKDCYSEMRDDLMAALKGDVDLWSEIMDAAFVCVGKRKREDSVDTSDWISARKEFL